MISLDEAAQRLQEIQEMADSGAPMTGILAASARIIASTLEQDAGPFAQAVATTAAGTLRTLADAVETLLSDNAAVDQALADVTIWKFEHVVDPLREYMPDVRRVKAEEERDAFLLMLDHEYAEAGEELNQRLADQGRAAAAAAK